MLTSIYASRVEINREVVVLLNECTSLTSLHLHECSLEPGVIESLGTLDVENFGWTNSPLGDEVVAAIEDCTNIRALQLSESGILRSTGAVPNRVDGESD